MTGIQTGTNWKFMLRMCLFIFRIHYIVKPIVNWALPNSLNTYDRHSDWHKLEVYATKMSTYLWLHYNWTLWQGWETSQF